MLMWCLNIEPSLPVEGEERGREREEERGKREKGRWGNGKKRRGGEK